MAPTFTASDERATVRECTKRRCCSTLVVTKLLASSMRLAAAIELVLTLRSSTTRSG
jgi:hypothetical protein